MSHNKGTEKDKKNTDTNLQSKATTEKKKKTHNPFKILKDKIKGLTHKKDKGDKKKQEPILNQTQPATTQPLASSVVSPTSRTIMTERPLGTEKISPPLALATSIAPETSAILNPKAVTVSTPVEATITSALPNITVTPPPSMVKTGVPVSVPIPPSTTTASNLPPAETVSLIKTADAISSSRTINPTTEQAERTKIEIKQANESTWDFSAIPDDDTEEFDQITPLTQRDTTENQVSRATRINAALEMYVPGWRLLMHSIVGPIAQHNIEASDAWMEKLAGFLPSTSEPQSLLAPQSIGFLPSDIRLTTTENAQKTGRLEEASTNHHTRNLLKI